MRQQERFIDSRGLPSEYQPDILWIRDFMIGVICLLGKKIEVFIAMLFHERGYGFMFDDCDERPVVKTRPSEMFFIQAVSQRMHEMKLCADGGAGSRYVPCVLRYFRFKKYDVQHNGNLSSTVGLGKCRHIRFYFGGGTCRTA